MPHLTFRIENEIENLRQWQAEGKPQNVFHENGRYFSYDEAFAELYRLKVAGKEYICNCPDPLPDGSCSCITGKIKTAGEVS